MKGLKCTSTDCEYNNHGHCEAGVINIAANGVCKTKLKLKDDGIDNEYSRLEVAEDFDYSDNDDVLIECDAKQCMYNKDHMCTSNIVNIQDSILKTKCVTRKLKK